jgi:chemotaxis protein MotB
MRKKASDDAPMNTGGWLTTYADMMNNLLVLFMALYAMSVMDLEKFQALANSLNSEFVGTASQVVENAAGIGANSDIEYPLSSPPLASGQPELTPDVAAQDFDKIYAAIQKKINESGYDDSILLEKSEGYIKFRFKDSVLFYPDSPKMKDTSYEILKYMGDLLLSIDPSIQTIEIGGHTATVNGGNTTSFFAWELSSDRAIAVLEFFVKNCSLPQAKMTVSGYSHYQPVAGNDNEEDRAQNRRVEVKITRVS